MSWKESYRCNWGFMNSGWLPEASFNTECLSCMCVGWAFNINKVSWPGVTHDGVDINLCHHESHPYRLFFPRSEWHSNQGIIQNWQKCSYNCNPCSMRSFQTGRGMYAPSTTQKIHLSHLSSSASIFHTSTRYEAHAHTLLMLLPEEQKLFLKVILSPFAPQSENVVGKGCLAS